MVAPAPWAPTADSTISSGVTGMAALCPGTVMPPVIAALMITFSTPLSFCRFLERGSPDNSRQDDRPPQTAAHNARR
jgi:hypothetical protein